MTDERDGRVDHALQELREALAIEPAPDFAARVRERVARDESRRWLGGWRLWSLAAAAAAVVAVVIAMPDFAVRPNDRAPALAPTSAGPEGPAYIGRVTGGAVPVQGGPEGPAYVRPVTGGAGPEGPAYMRPVPHAQAGVRSGSPNRIAPGAVMTSAAAVKQLEHEVLVPPDQALALRRLLAAIREGRAFVPAGEPIIDDATGDLIIPAPLTRTRGPVAGNTGRRGRQER